jgi:hypothetical protein
LKYTNREDFRATLGTIGKTVLGKTSIDHRQFVRQNYVQGDFHRTALLKGNGVLHCVNGHP